MNCTYCKEFHVYFSNFNRWFAKGEDDGKIVRELLPTDEHGNALETGLQGRYFDFLLSMYTKPTLFFY